MKTSELYDKLCGYIPQDLCCDWDNDGLSVLPHPDHESKKILFALDLRDAVIKYAKENGFDTVITHHPLIFSPLKELNGASVTSRKALHLIAANVAAMSFHTRFDALDGGTNDVLCKKLDLEPTGRFGEKDIGRLCVIPPSDFEEFASFVKKELQSSHFYTEISPLQSGKISKIAVCTGAAGDMVEDARKAGADALLCGEMKYHEMIDASDLGLSVICAGHYETEFPALQKLKELVESAGEFYTEIYDAI